MEDLGAIFNQIVAFLKSDTFKSITNSLTTLVKSIDYNQIIAVVKKIVELVGTLSK